jgi:hypothetical protein
LPAKICSGEAALRPDFSSCSHSSVKDRHCRYHPLLPTSLVGRLCMPPRQPQVPAASDPDPAKVALKTRTGHSLVSPVQDLEHYAQSQIMPRRKTFLSTRSATPVRHIGIIKVPPRRRTACPRSPYPPPRGPLPPYAAMKAITSLRNRSRCVSTRPCGAPS